METNLKQQLDLLESELKLIQDNIVRVKQYSNNEQNKGYRPYHCHVFGELKHRCVDLKQRLTIVNNFSTSNLFKR